MDADRGGYAVPPSMLLLAGKLPARGPDVPRLSANLRAPARDNRSRVPFPWSILWVVLAFISMFLIVVGALLLGLFLLRR